MTDWARVEKLRSKGASWTEVAADRKVGFQAPAGSDPARALKILHLQRKSRTGRSGAGGPEGRLRSLREAPKGPAGHRGLVIAGVVVVAVILAAYAYEADQKAAGKPAGWVGTVAPGFSLASANGGGTFDLVSERNQTNVLLFFNEGLSCSPCLAQMQQLDSDAGEFQTIHVLVVSITGDSLSDMSTWAANSHMTHTMVLADPTLSVSNAYDTTGAAVSMMPGSAPGHTFVLVDLKGVVLWRADYGPSDMSVPDSDIFTAVQSVLGN